MTRFAFLTLTALLGLASLWAGASPAAAQRSDQGSRSAPEAGTAGVEPDPATLEQYAFEVPYLEGDNTLTFEELAKGGMPFVLFWWLADCPICHLQMPYIQQLQNYIEKDQLNLRVVGIDVDTTPEECLDYLKDKDISFEMLFDRRARKTDKAFQVEELGCPLIYVFNTGGEFVEVYTGFRAGVVRKVLEQLDLPIPKDLEK